MLNLKAIAVPQNFSFIADFSGSFRMNFLLSQTMRYQLVKTGVTALRYSNKIAGNFARGAHDGNSVPHNVRCDSWFTVIRGSL